MSDWKLLLSESEIKDQISEIKKNNKGHYYTNYLSFRSNLDEELKYTEAFWTREGENLYLIKRHDDFYRLYYACGDLGSFSFEGFPKSFLTGKVTCEILEMEGREKQLPVIEKLKESGFSEYKKYHLWSYTHKHYEMPNIRNFRFEDEADSNRLMALYDIFDPVSDKLPVKRMFDEYLKSVYAFSGFWKDKYLGSVIYRINGNAAEGEYSFVVKGTVGAGGMLWIEYLNRCFEKHNALQVHGWVADDNIQSIEIHHSLGSSITQQYKITLIKGF